MEAVVVEHTGRRGQWKEMRRELVLRDEVTKLVDELPLRRAELCMRMRW